MLSIAVIKNASAASHYYEADNYYAKDSPEAAAATHWWGKGAEQLGLTGHVDSKQFEQLLLGKLPNGSQLGRLNDAKQAHRPGYDLTFSAPKSVSVMAEVLNDKRIYQAHDNAVNQTLAHLQSNAAQTRSSIDGVTSCEKTDNVTVAKFRHDTSRELDPQLHTHCVVLNMTKREDGQWRSLSSEQLFEQKMLAGGFYRSVLAFELKHLGYSSEKMHGDGRFELANVPSEIIQHFSTRREQIEKLMEERGVRGSKAASSAALMSREKKQEVNREDIKKEWIKEWKSLGVKICRVPTKIREHDKSRWQPEKAAQKAVKYAHEHLSEREAVFTHNELLRVAIANAIGNALPQHIEQAIEKARDDKKLIPHLDHPSQGTYWTTPTAIKYEKENIQMMAEGQFKQKSIANVNRIDKALSKYKLTTGQNAAAKHILCTKDTVVGIQGYAGTGKTTMLKVVNDIARKKGFEIIGIAPSAAAAKQLEDGAGVRAQTLSRFLIEQEKEKHSPHSKRLIVLDEASMVSTFQMNKLLKSIAGEKSRLVLVGDTKQLGAIEAGKPFYQLQKAGMKTSIMKEIMRQQTPSLLDAVEASLRGDVRRAINKIGDRVYETPDQHERLLCIAKDYLKLSPKQRESTLVLTSANEDKEVINHNIREGLKEKGQLSGKETATHVLMNRGLTRAERTSVANYEVGDVVRFNKTYKTLGIKASEYLRITHIDSSKNEILLQNKQGNSIPWDPDAVAGQRAGAIEVYSQELREAMIGDEIRWLRNDKENNLYNAETLKIDELNNNKMKVILQNGKSVHLDLNNPKHQHWDHAYASTVHAAQGKTADIVLAHGESYRRNLTNQQSFYVTISRARQEAHIYTDNQLEYMKVLEKYTGEKTSAIKGGRDDYSIEISNDPKEKSGISKQKDATERLNELSL